MAGAGGACGGQPRAVHPGGPTAAGSPSWSRPGDGGPASSGHRGPSKISGPLAHVRREADWGPGWLESACAGRNGGLALLRRAKASSTWPGPSQPPAGAPGTGAGRGPGSKSGAQGRGGRPDPRRQPRFLRQLFRTKSSFLFLFVFGFGVMSLLHTF